MFKEDEGVIGSIPLTIGSGYLHFAFLFVSVFEFAPFLMCFVALYPERFHVR